ncbi:lipopolysaccharide biosynthesis protein [Cohnella thailandensis]|uniref:Oligosaccharide flippase family protein n=1 Tax=Cohnella thailandensis TaxID=557557 RepID=A0A841T1R7_9BACL|nr:oligosaccharide flippase family protein [Cohnella thailandensis]MBB6635817.1 oligosaccharide flippase family protein [Cohnella thailandensis]MBP1976195.1 O-antigen/teichoic acid export membrane protein [Cohnella thailandensis]
MIRTVIKPIARGRALSGRGALSAIMRTSAASTIVMLVSMISSVVTARWFGVEGKGEFSAIVFWPTLLAGVLSFGLPTSLIYNRRSNPEQGADVVRAGFLFQLPVCLLAGVVAWYGLPAWMGNYSDGIVGIARWYTVLMLPMLLAIGLLTALAQSMENFNLYNGLRLYVPLSNLLGLAALWAIGRLDQAAASLIYLGTSLIVLVWSLYRMRGELSVGWFGKFSDRGAVKKLFGYGGRVYGVELLGTLYGQCDKLIVLALLSPRAFGLYTVVYTLSRVFNIVQTAISSVVFPKVTGQERELILSKVCRAFRLSFALMLVALVPGLIVGRWLLGLLYGPAFLESSAAFALLSLECIIGGGSWILATSFNAMGRPGLVAVRQAIALAITIGMLFALAPAFGLNGIALAMLIGACARLAITIAAMKLVFKTPISGVFFDKGDWRFLLGRLSRQA